MRETEMAPTPEPIEGRHPGAYCTVPAHRNGEHDQDCVPPADPGNQELRLIRAIWGLCALCDRKDEHDHPEDHNRIITPDTDPNRFTEEETRLFREGKCSQLVAHGMPWDEHCGKPSEPGASFGNCAGHNAELLEDAYPDGTPRPS
jgi:hypothetical protein